MILTLKIQDIRSAKERIKGAVSIRRALDLDRMVASGLFDYEGSHNSGRFTTGQTNHLTANIKRPA
jgi:hypothetical protein